MGPSADAAAKPHARSPSGGGGGYAGVPGMAPPVASAAKQPKAKAKSVPKAKASESPAVPKASADSPAVTQAKPENRLRNLRKKLAEIETLEERAAVETLSEEQQQKLGRKDEFQAEVKELEEQLAQLQM
eukprot:TRINITY_DN23482_c0_g1_i1.p1 TRINITY_DN23482_c0_g1~~TRINITY_DN23482_c0_g1_i1.p1  ORF type:complete len:130 (-),score=46.81 TRINITY_DN23482_c0_g1_i1:15-404(-)